MTLKASLDIALRALSRNRLRTALTMLGMTIGVATVLTMIAVGSGAQSAIEQQVRAAGMNLIVVTAGNYQMKIETDNGGVVDHTAYRPRPYIPSFSRPHVVLAHAEDDPMEKHDHPLARERLGDNEAG